MTTESRPPKLAPADELFVQNMKTLRRERGMSQNALAQEVRDRGVPGFNQVALSRIEAGTRALGLTEARAIADALGGEVEQMILPPESAKAISTLLGARMSYQEGWNRVGSGLTTMDLSLHEALEAMETLKDLDLRAVLPEQAAGRVESARLAMDTVVSGQLLKKLVDAYGEHYRLFGR